MQIDDFVLDEIVEELEQSSHYWARRDAIREANAADPLMVRGLALTPVKFGISFTATWFNQAGALLHIYRDGASISITAGRRWDRAFSSRSHKS